jgi:hypothetical protein
MQVVMGCLHTSAMLMLKHLHWPFDTIIYFRNAQKATCILRNGHECKHKVSVYEQHIFAAWIVKWPLKHMLEIVDVEIK